MVKTNMNKYNLYAKYITKQTNEGESSLVSSKLSLNEEPKHYIKSGWGINVGNDFTRLTQDTPLELSGETKGSRVYGWIEGDPNHKLHFMRGKRIKVEAEKRSVFLKENENLDEGFKRKFTNWLNKKERTKAHLSKIERYRDKLEKEANKVNPYEQEAEWKAKNARSSRWNRVGFDAKLRTSIFRDVATPKDYWGKSGKWLGGKWETTDKLKEETNEIKVGSKIHAGLKNKNGAGYSGTVTKIEGDWVYFNINAPHKKEFGPRTGKSHISMVSLNEETISENKKPVFGLMVNPRPYKCKDCGHEMELKTNHTDDVSAVCPSCSWKPSFGKTGHKTSQLGNNTYRRFNYIGDDPSDFNPHSPINKKKKITEGRLPKWANKPDFSPQHVERGPPGSYTKSSGYRNEDRRRKYKYSMGPLGSVQYDSERPPSLRTLQQHYKNAVEFGDSNRMRKLKQRINHLKKHPSEARKRSKWETIERNYNKGAEYPYLSNPEKITKPQGRINKDKRLES